LFLLKTKKLKIVHKAKSTNSETDVNGRIFNIESKKIEKVRIIKPNVFAKANERVEFLKITIDVGIETPPTAKKTSHQMEIFNRS